MIELGKLTKSFFASFHGAKGSANNLFADGIGGAGLSAESYQHHGFASSPPKGTRVIFAPFGRGRKYGAIIAEHNYSVTVEMAYGGTTIYSTSADGKTVKAKIELDNAGKIKIANETKSLKTVLDTLISHISALTTINCVSGAPVTLSPAVIAQLTQDKADLALLLKD